MTGCPRCCRWRCRCSRPEAQPQQDAPRRCGATTDSGCPGGLGVLAFSVRGRHPHAPVPGCRIVAAAFGSAPDTSGGRLRVIVAATRSAIAMKVEETADDAPTSSRRITLLDDGNTAPTPARIFLWHFHFATTCCHLPRMAVRPGSLGFPPVTARMPRTELPSQWLSPFHCGSASTPSGPASPH